MDLFEEDASSSEEEAGRETEVATVIWRLVRRRRRRGRHKLRVVCVGHDERATALASALDDLEARAEGADHGDASACDVLVIAEECGAWASGKVAVARGGVAATAPGLRAPSAFRGPEFVAVAVGEWRLFRRRMVVADSVGCPPWGPAGEAEHDRAESITAFTREEKEESPDADDDDDEGRAGAILRAKGVVVVPEFCSAAAVEALGTVALSQFEGCRSALLSKHGVDLLRPGENGREVRSYRELASREDFRCDVRLEDLRRTHLVDLDAARRVAGAASSSRDDFSREEVDLRRGNFGRWNFDDGGPEAPRPLPTVAGAGAVVALPGAGEQALHADAAHLFDHVTLPGHYYQLFIPACDAPDAGQTAFVLGTHDLATCAALLDDPDRPRALKRRLVRPRLQTGDALIFDARILHFGLPNRSRDTRRPLLYWNLHLPWFKGDPKNWDQRRSVFSETLVLDDRREEDELEDHRE